MLGLDEATAFCGGSMTGASTCRRVVPVNYLRRTSSDKPLLFEARPALNMPCQDKGMRLEATR